MSTEDVRKNKELLEDEILLLVDNFQKLTGTVVDYVAIETNTGRVGAFSHEIILSQKVIVKATI